MRIKNSIINICTGIGNQILITVLSFISRTIFINNLGIQYLGVNELLSNIILIISLAESGIGASIVFSLYKPVAENDEKKILILMGLYKKAFRIIALIVFILGIILMPFVTYITKEYSVDNIYLIYLIFLINTCVSYIFSYKISFLNVCQKRYLVTAVYSISAIISIVSKILVLYFTKNYILYLTIDIFITICTTIGLSILVDKMYPFIKKSCKEKLDMQTKNDIVKNVKSLIVHNIGEKCIIAIDNLVISSFIGIVAVGIYSNYNMLINICRTFINNIFNGIDHSMGNLIATESKEKIYSVFKIMLLINFWIYSFFSICLYILINPVVKLWIGEKFLMNEATLIILIIGFYISGMKRSIIMVKVKAGIFYEDRFATVIEAALNLILSIILIRNMGMSGVFLATILSTLLVSFWVAPYLVYKKVFKKYLKEYFGLYIRYIFIGLIACIVTKISCDLILVNTFFSLILKAIICVILPNLIYILILYRTEEFKNIYSLFYNIISKKGCSLVNKF